MFTRARYAVGIYLIVFGSIIVAAFKMGMVHERVKVTTAKSLGTSDAVTPTTTDVDSGQVLEVNDPQRKIEHEERDQEKGDRAA